MDFDALLAQARELLQRQLKQLVDFRLERRCGHLGQYNDGGDTCELPTPNCELPNGLPTPNAQLQLIS